MAAALRGPAAGWVSQLPVGVIARHLASAAGEAGPASVRSSAARGLLAPPPPPSETRPLPALASSRCIDPHAAAASFAQRVLTAAAGCSRLPSLLRTAGPVAGAAGRPRGAALRRPRRAALPAGHGHQRPAAAGRRPGRRRPWRCRRRRRRRCGCFLGERFTTRADARLRGAAQPQGQGAARRDGARRAALWRRRRRAAAGRGRRQPRGGPLPAVAVRARARAAAATHCAAAPSDRSDAQCLRPACSRPSPAARRPPASWQAGTSCGGR